MEKYVIMGLGDFTEIVYYMMTKEMHLPVIAFCVDEEYLPESGTHHGLPVFSFETIEKHVNSKECHMVLAFLGGEMFETRKNKYREAKKKGFSFPNIIHPSVRMENAQIGEGNIFLEEVLISYFAKIGDGNVFWSRSMIQHHNKVGSFNLIAPNSSPSGYVEIGNQCFIGNNSTIKNRVKINDFTFVGANAYVSKDTKRYEVIVPEKS